MGREPNARSPVCFHVVTLLPTPVHPARYKHLGVGLRTSRCVPPIVPASGVEVGPSPGRTGSDEADGESNGRGFDGTEDSSEPVDCAGEAMQPETECVSVEDRGEVATPISKRRSGHRATALAAATGTLLLLFFLLGGRVHQPRPTAVQPSSSIVGPKSTATSAIASAPNLELPPPSGNSVRTRPLHLVILLDPTLDAAATTALDRELPADLAYFKRWYFPGDTLATLSLPETATDDPIQVDRLFPSNPALDGPQMIRLAEQTWAPSPEGDRALVVVTTDPSSWSGLLPTSSTSMQQSLSTRRPPLTRSYLLVLGGSSSNIGPAGPYPADVGATLNEFGSVARAIAQVWVNGTGAIWRG